MAWSRAVSDFVQNGSDSWLPLGVVCLDQRIHQLQSIFLIPQVAEGVIAVRLFQIHEIQHADVIALLFQVSAVSVRTSIFGSVIT